MSAKIHDTRSVDALLPGDTGRMGSTADVVADCYADFLSIIQLLGEATTNSWSGSAADAYNSKRNSALDELNKGVSALANCHGAIEYYQSSFDSARTLVGEAVTQFEAAEKATKDAKKQYDAKRPKDEARNSQTNQDWDWGFTDPSYRSRQDAQDTVTNAQSSVAGAAAEASNVIRVAANQAPGRQSWQHALDGVAGLGESAWDAISGTATLVWDWSLVGMFQKYQTDGLVGFAEYYKQSYVDPVEYLFQHPGDALWGMWTDFIVEDKWDEDPAHATGQLSGNIIIAVLPWIGLSRIPKVFGRFTERLKTGDAAKAELLRKEFEKLSETKGPDGYKPFGDLTPQAWFDKYFTGFNEKGHPEYNWPLHEGFGGPAVPNRLTPGKIIDRYTPPGRDGFFTSPRGTSFTDRAIPPDRLGFEFKEYEVLNPLPKEVLEGPITEHFGQPGKGLQYYFPEGMQYYVNEGFLKEIVK